MDMCIFKKLYNGTTIYKKAMSVPNNNYSKNLTFGILMIMVVWNDFTSSSITRSLKNIKSIIWYKMSVMIHIPYWPITQLTIINNCATSF